MVPYRNHVKKTTFTHFYDTGAPSPSFQQQQQQQQDEPKTPLSPAPAAPQASPASATPRPAPHPERPGPLSPQIPTEPGRPHLRPVTLPACELSSELEDWIWKDNMEFLRDKSMFDHTFFK